MMTDDIALLIIDVQKSAVHSFPGLPKKIESLQKKYKNVFVSCYTARGSFLPHIMNWGGYEDEGLAFVPDDKAKVFEKTGYTSFLPEMENFKEIHICGFDTDACVYKTALDLVEAGVRPIVLANYCGSQNKELHLTALKLLERNIGEINVKYGW